MNMTFLPANLRSFFIIILTFICGAFDTIFTVILPWTKKITFTAMALPTQPPIPEYHTYRTALLNTRHPHTNSHPSVSSMPVHSVSSTRTLHINTLATSHLPDPPQDRSHTESTITITTRCLTQYLHRAHHILLIAKSPKTKRRPQFETTMPTSSRSHPLPPKTRSATQKQAKLPLPTPEKQTNPTPPLPPSNSSPSNIEPLPMDYSQPELPTPMDTTDSLAQHPLSQEDNSNINEILNGINNPHLLQDSTNQDTEKETSPSNSPAKKKAKPSSPNKNQNPPPNPSNSQKQKTKKRSSSSGPCLCP